MELNQEEILLIQELFDSDDSDDICSFESSSSQGISSSDSSSEEEIEEFLVQLLGKDTIENYLTDIVPKYSDKEFKTHFRVSRELFAELSAKMEVSECFSKLDKFKRYSSEMHLALFLWFAGHEACSYRDVADRFDLAVGTVCNIINRTAMFLSNMSPEIILWPSPQEMKSTSDHMYVKTGLKGIIGVIDGMHIRIDPPKIGKEEYIDKRGVFSISMQGICNEKRRFIDFFVGYPGSVPEDRVYKNSEAPERVENIPEGYYIVGDLAYQCTDKLITPYKNNGNLSPQQKYFNQKLCPARLIIKRSFEALKQRFRQLCYCKLKGVTKICHFVKACVVLHNLCIADGENYISVDTTEVLEESVHDEDLLGSNEKVALRNRLCDKLYSNR